MPEAGIGNYELNRRVEFFGLRGRDQLDRAFDFLACPHVQKGDGLVLIKRHSQFHERAMRIYNDGVSCFAERRFSGKFPFDDHANLKK